MNAPHSPTANRRKISFLYTKQAFKRLVLAGRRENGDSVSDKETVGGQRVRAEREGPPLLLREVKCL